MAISLKTDYAEPYNNRGSAYDSTGDFDTAIQDYKKAIQLDPNLTIAKDNLDMALRNKKKQDQN